MQVRIFSSKGLKAAYVSGEATDDLIKDRVCRGEYQLVFITPEMIINHKTWRKVIDGDIYTKRLKAFVIDEAHCVKKWSVEQKIFPLKCVLLYCACLNSVVEF